MSFWTSDNRVFIVKFKGNRELYYKGLFIYGIYFRDIYDYVSSRNYFTQIYADNPDSNIGDLSLLELASLDLKEGKYEDLLGRIRGVRGKEYEAKKMAYSVTALLKLGRVPDAMDIFKKSADLIAKSDLGRSFMKDMIVALAQSESIDEIQYVGKYLSNKFPAESDYVNYYIGNYYYKKEQYDRAISYFGRIQSQTSGFRNEVVYKMGIINELALKNIKTAAYYFGMLQDVKEYDEYIAASRIELAIIYNERGMKDQSRKILDDIMNRKENVAAMIRAGNLFSQFGFDKVEVKK